MTFAELKTSFGKTYKDDFASLPNHLLPKDDDRVGAHSWMPKDLPPGKARINIVWAKRAFWIYEPNKKKLVTRHISWNGRAVKQTWQEVADITGWKKK